MTTLEKINELRTASINFIISRMKYRAGSKELDGHSVKYRDVSSSGYYLNDNMDTLEDTISILAMHEHYRSEETPVPIQSDEVMPASLIYEDPINTSDSGLSLYVYDTYTKRYGYVRFDDLCVENMDLVLSYIL